MTVHGLSSNFIDLGSPFLHQHFIMLLERLGKNDKLIRSRIRNQTMFDLLHVLELIDNSQHQAGEILLERAVKSGYFLNPVNYEMQVQKNNPPSSSSNFALRSLQITKIMRVLKKKLGGNYANYVFNVVVLNHPIKTQNDLDLVRIGLNLVKNHYRIGRSLNESSKLALQCVVNVA